MFNVCFGDFARPLGVDSVVERPLVPGNLNAIAALAGVQLLSVSMAFAALDLASSTC
jgi:hypothetical protein